MMYINKSKNKNYMSKNDMKMKSVDEMLQADYDRRMKKERKMNRNIF